ncbi:hypothetical protein TNCT_94891 [Trichonephila clavata]|uniref:Uncharacterized protein n=1 Tax=Trichonephila clavata TaxID=2740835 RepID=A0A8X6KTZ9_TRICU|nr:hypothetical protein TNCT_94891 [Trichonephila clavata]
MEWESLWTVQSWTIVNERNRYGPWAKAIALPGASEVLESCKMEIIMSQEVRGWIFGRIFGFVQAESLRIQRFLQQMACSHEVVSFMRRYLDLLSGLQYLALLLSSWPSRWLIFAKLSVFM